MKNIAIIGYGVVGGGITEVLEKNRENIKKIAGDDVFVKHILDLRDFPDSPYADRITHDIGTILSDPEVMVVCETMGGSHPALEFSLKCMEAGKSVVTSNKEVVANFGDVLLECAEKNGVSYMFEASVGGGIPLIRSLNTSLAGDTVTEIKGIVNGTTNYILTKMKKEGMSFESALKDAQDQGYAERDPSADIDAIDAKRKIIILTALASGKLLPDDAVYAGGIGHISLVDIKTADVYKSEIKLIAFSEIRDGKICAYACPAMVPRTDLLSGIDGVYNAISVNSDVTGDVVFYGRGAGRMPTAGAVMADVCAVLSGAAEKENVPAFEKIGRSDPAVALFEDKKARFHVRFDVRHEVVEKYLSEKCLEFKITGFFDTRTEAVIKDISLREIHEISPDAAAIIML